jgi:L-amino acid N-acyltransferase YncA
VAVRAMETADWPAVRGIFAQGIDSGDATFETAPPEWDEWDAAHLTALRLVATVEGAVAGWAALSPVSERCVYGGVAEVSVYVGRAHTGRGVGTALLTRLVAESERAGLWTLQAGIFPENVVSLALHARCGFRTVGVRERLGRTGERWRDVVLLERRSPSVG